MEQYKGGYTTRSKLCVYLPSYANAYVQSLDLGLVPVLRLQPVNYGLHREGRRSGVREQQHKHRSAGADAGAELGCVTERALAGCAA